jgi:hypothetical protein
MKKESRKQLKNIYMLKCEISLEVYTIFAFCFVIIIKFYTQSDGGLLRGNIYT